MILRISETVSTLPGPDAALIFLALEPFLLVPFFEVLASDCRKRPPILRYNRECLLFQINDIGAHFILLFEFLLSTSFPKVPSPTSLATSTANP
jgi:hypothetical protein